MKKNVLLLTLFFAVSISDIAASQMMGSFPTEGTPSTESLTADVLDKKEENKGASLSTQALSDSLLYSQEDISTPSIKMDDRPSSDHPEIAPNPVSSNSIAVD